MANSACPPYTALADDNICNIQLHELVQSREQYSTPRGDTWILKFAVIGTDQECEVLARLEDGTLGVPAVFDYEPRRDWHIQRVGQWIWQVAVTYGHVPYNRPIIGALPASVNCSTMGGSEHLTQAIFDIDSSDNAPDVWGAIEFDGKTIKGVDVPAANTRWRETWKMSRRELYNRPGARMGGINAWFENSDYHELNNLSLIERYDKMVGYVHGYDWGVRGNVTVADLQLPFRHFDQGSLLFAGAVVSQLDQWYYEVVLEFMHEPNSWETLPSSIGNLFTRQADAETPAIRFENGEHQLYKNGWDYISFSYVEKDTDPGDDLGKVTLPQPVHYQLQQTQPYAPFNYLGVPMGPMFGAGHAPEKPDCLETIERAGPLWDASVCS